MVEVTVERAARNSRRLYAAVQVAAPVDIVWGALTDYEGLGSFIPGALIKSYQRKYHNSAGRQLELSHTSYLHSMQCT